MKNITILLVLTLALGLTSQAIADSRNVLFDEDYAMDMAVGFAECKPEMLEESLQQALEEVAAAFIKGGNFDMKAAYIASEKVKLNNLTEVQYANWGKCHFNKRDNLHYDNAKSVLLGQIYKVAPFAQ